LDNTNNVASIPFVGQKNGKKGNVHGCNIILVGQMLKYREYLYMIYLQATPAHDPAISSMESGVVRSNKSRFQKLPTLVVNSKPMQVHKIKSEFKITDVNFRSSTM